MNADQRPQHPMRTLMALLITGVACVLLSFVWPEEGISMAGTTLSFVTLDELVANEPEGIADADDFLKGYDAILQEDSAASPTDTSAANAEVEKALQDSLREAELERRRQLLEIQQGANGIENLQVFFEGLESAKSQNQKLRVLHYGDSQIEGDRITGYLRNELQKRYGGNGPGLIPPVEVVPSIAIEQEADENWQRYTVYGKRDTTIKHERYGLMGTFAEADSTGGNLIFRPSPRTYKLSKTWSTAKLFLGHFSDSLIAECYYNDSLIDRLLLQDSSGYRAWSLTLPGTPEELRFSFSGSIESYGIALEGPSGVQVDNIPMRGSSGTIFKRISRDQLRKQYRELNPGLVLLQYGGNTVPYISDSTKAENYGRWMQSQILYLKALMPEAAFILIGPSDMAYKEGENFVTYPYLEVVRNELKKAAFETSCGFWDIYEVMGGANSMSAWVKADPPLAGKDYVHFTPKGARRIAELFTKALLDEREREE